MIISNSTGSSQVYGEVAGGKYTISMGGGLYRTLAKELYSDIEGAIVRELSCNAVDIHNEIGQTKPYKITIKDGLFSIRDFGTGIPKKDIQKYATFGYSSKEESNDGIGGFGLGSKTPFAYTNNYTIRSYVDGTLYTYNVFGNDDDLSVMFASEESTDEANGLEILFEIKKDGEDQFIDRVNEICGWLSVPCELVTENGTEIVANKPLLDLNSGMFITGSSSRFRSWLICRVSMGGVHYSVPIEWLRSLSSKFYSCKKFNKINSGDYAVVFKFNIGELEIPRSRESIADTESNKTLLMNRVDEFYDEFLEYIDKTFADLSAWESAQLAQNELKNELGESLATSVVSAHLDENPKEIFSGKNDEFTYTLHSFDGLISPNEIIIHGANENPKELVDLRLNAGATGVITARPAKHSGLNKDELVETLKKKPSLDGFDNFTIFEGNLNRTLNRYSGVLTSNGERVRLNSITIEDYLFIPQSKANSLFHEGELLALYKTLMNLKDVSEIKDIVVITDLAHDYLISNNLTTDYREKLTSFSEEYLSTPLIQRMLEEYKVYLSSQYIGFSNNYPSLYVVLDGLGIDGLKFIGEDTKSYHHFNHKPILMNLLGGFSEIESCTVKEIYELLQDDRMSVLQFVNGSDPKLLKAALRFFKTGELVD